MTLRDQFEKEVEASGLSFLFATKNSEYLQWLENKVLSLEGDYPIQDDTWPSRRWNRDMTDYEDLSGHE